MVGIDRPKQKKRIPIKMNASHYTSLSRVDHKKGKNKKENLLITKYFFYILLGFDMSQAILHLFIDFVRNMTKFI